MYPTLRAEMARKNVTNKDLASLLGRTEQTISFKMNGKNIDTGFTLDEAIKIRDYLDVTIPIDELFEKGE